MCKSVQLRTYRLDHLSGAPMLLWTPPPSQSPPPLGEPSRLKAGLHNFDTLYRPLVNEWQTIDNGGPVPRLLSEGGRP
jgi:hypothetical protein